MNSSGVMQLQLYPTPNGARDYSVNCIIPDSKLVTNLDTFAAPAEPVYLHAVAMAMKERGEDQGQSYNEAYDQFRRSLSRHIVLNKQARGGVESWQVV